MARIASGSKNSLSPQKKAALIGAAIGALVASVLLGPAPAGASERVLVAVDHAQLLRLKNPATSVIVGNPMIADAVVHDNYMLVITGKSYGSTNLIVLNEDGEEILNQTLEVRFGSNSVITMHKGAGRQSYSCSPVCEPTLLSGDTKEYFEGVQAQISSRIDTATASGVAKAP